MYRWLAIAVAIVLMPLAVVLSVVKLRDSKDASSTNVPPAVLSIDGYRVTEREFRLRVDAVKSNVDYMQGVATSDSASADFMSEYADLIRNTGPDRVALAGVIADAAVYEWGVEHGLDVSQEELDAALDEQRELVATADDPSVQERRDFIADVGEDSFWNEIMPRVLRYDLMKEKVREKQADWAGFQRQIVEGASVESLDTDLINQTMIDQAVEYFTEDYPAFQAEHPQQ